MRVDTGYECGRALSPLFDWRSSLSRVHEVNPSPVRTLEYGLKCDDPPWIETRKEAEVTIKLKELTRIPSTPERSQHLGK